MCGFFSILHVLNFLSSKNMLGYSATRGLHKYADPKFEHIWLGRRYVLEYSQTCIQSNCYHNEVVAVGLVWISYVSVWLC